MNRWRWIRMSLLLVIAPRVLAVQATYQIQVSGTGPGIEQKAVNYYVNYPECTGCTAILSYQHGARPGACDYPQTNIPPFSYVEVPQVSGCLPGGCAIAGYQFTDAVKGPVQVTWDFSPGQDFVQMVINGVEVPGSSGKCVMLPSGAWSGSTSGGPLTVQGIWCGEYAYGPYNCVTSAHCGGALDDNNTGCMGPPTLFTFGVTYPRPSDSAPYYCTLTGTTDVPPNGAWGLVTQAACLPPNVTANEWSVGMSAENYKVEAKMVADPADPDSSSGPYLIARAFPPSDPCSPCVSGCPPPCPQPDPCAVCMPGCPPPCPQPDPCNPCVAGCPPPCPQPDPCSICMPGCPPPCPAPTSCDPWVPGCPIPPTCDSCAPGCPPPCPAPPVCSPCVAGCPPPCPQPAACDPWVPGCPTPPTCSPCALGCPPPCPPADACMPWVAGCPLPASCSPCAPGCPPPCPQPQPCLTVSGRVGYAAGLNNWVADATVVVLRFSLDQSVAATLATGADGRYTFKAATPGLYGFVAYKGAAFAGLTMVNLEGPDCTPDLVHLMTCPGCAPFVGQQLLQGNPAWACYRNDCLEQYACSTGSRCGVDSQTPLCPLPAHCMARLSFSSGACVLMCAAMLAGNNDPVDLNRRLTEGRQITSEGDVDWVKTGKFLGLGTYRELPYSPESLRTMLCNGGSVIAEVSESPAHFVVVTGIVTEPSGACRFTIADPATEHHKSYLLRVEAPGSPDDGYGGVSSLRLYCPSGNCGIPVETQ